MSGAVFAFHPALWPLPDPYKHGGAHLRECVPMRGMWLYVFRSRVVGEPVEWIREVWVNEDGQVCPTLDANPLDPGCVRPERGAPSATNLVVLAEGLPSGHPHAYYFLASQVRLYEEGVQSVLDGLWQELDVFEFSVHNYRYWIPTLEEAEKFEVPHLPLVVVTEPLTIMSGLWEQWYRARTAWLEWNVPAPLPPPDLPGREKAEQQRTEVQERQRRYLLMSLIESVLESDSSESLSGNLDRDKLQAQLGSAELIRSQLVGASDRASEALTGWLEGPLVGLIYEAAEASPLREDEVPKFLLQYSHALESLPATPAGWRYLERVLEDSNHFVNHYVFSETYLTTDEAQVHRRSLEAIFEIMNQALWPWFKANIDQPTRATAKLLRIHNVLDGVERAALAIGDVDFAQHVARVRFVARGAVFELEEGADVHLREVFKRLGSANPELILHGLNSAVQALNLMGGMISAYENPSLSNIVNLGGSILDLAAALEEPLKADLIAEIGEEAFEAQFARWWRVAFVSINIASAAIDFGFAFVAAREAYELGDDSTVAGNALIMAGCVASVIGIWFPPAAVVGAIGIFLGTLVAAYWADSTWDNYLQFCEWGVEVGGGGGDVRPHWSPVQLRDLAGSTSYQLEALTNLLGSYALESGTSGHDPSTAGELSIQPTVLEEGSTFEIELRCTVLVGNRTDPMDRDYYGAQALWKMRWGDESAQLVEGDENIASAVVHYTDTERRSGQFAVYPNSSGPIPGARPEQIISADWRVRLDLDGEGRRHLPADGWLSLGEGVRIDYATGPVLQNGPSIWSGWWNVGWVTLLRGEGAIQPGGSFDVELECKAAFSRYGRLEPRTVRWRVPWHGSSARPVRLSGSEWPEEKLEITRDGDSRLDFKVEGFQVSGVEFPYLQDVVWRVRFDVDGTERDFLPSAGFGEVGPGERVPLAEARVVFP